MNKEIRKKLKGYKLTKKILDERFKGKKFKTDTGAGTFFCYDALYYGNDCISPDEYKLHELVDWIKTLLGTGANVHHPILYHINKEKAVEVVNEIIEIIKEKEEKSKIYKEPEYDMYDMVESAKDWPIIDEMKKQEKESMKKQKATLKLADGREIEVEISEDELKKIQVKNSPYKRGNYKEKTKYYYISDYNNAVYENNEECDCAAGRYYDALNYYNDKEFAEKIARADLLMRKLRKFAVESRIFNRPGSMYQIFFDDYDKIPYSSPCADINTGNILFTSEAACKKAIDTFHDELIWYFTEYLKIYE